MKPFLVLLTLASSTPALAESHVRARNCEIFVDRVGVSYGSHGSANVHFFIKTINSRLDSPIARVGARMQASVDSRYGRNVESWEDVNARSFVGSSDYFELSRNVSNEYASARFEAAFFVQTDRGTFYWLKPEWTNQFVDRENYSFDHNLFQTVKDILSISYPYRGAREDSAGTVSYPLDVFNPQHCQ